MRIEIEKLKKAYQGVMVLDIERMTIKTGKITAIVGPNGAGKSTLLNLIGNLIQKDEGRILYNGDEKVPEKDLTLVFQEPYLIASTVKKNIAYPMKLRKFSKEAIEARIRELAEELNLEALLNKKANQLSLGEVQKVALARALSFKPELLLLDEPCASTVSYTHLELSIWEKCGIEPSGDWYVEAGAGMGAVLEMANETLAYTLSDRATWLNLALDEDLMIVCEKDESGVLYNQYGVICVNPEKNDAINYEGAKAFQNWIVSEETQTLMGEYGVEKYGAPLFTPNAQ